MRAYRRLLIFGALTLIWMAATIIVQGGWQAASAAFAIAAGGGFALTFASIRAASERPRSRHPSWARASDWPRHGIAAETPARRAAAPAPDGSQQATSGRRPLAPRPARTVYAAARIQGLTNGSRSRHNPRSTASPYLPETR